MKRVIKDFGGRAVFAFRLDTLLLRNTALVVAFHRVQETTADADGLTVDVATFERYGRFFRDHFRVTPLRVLVDKLERGLGVDRELAITFDDGYRDNFEQAAPAAPLVAAGDVERSDMASSYANNDAREVSAERGGWRLSGR